MVLMQLKRFFNPPAKNNISGESQCLFEIFFGAMFNAGAD